jgi:Hint domain
MNKNDKESQDSQALLAASKPTLQTSRRNFLAGMRTAGVLIAATAIVARPHAAKAQVPPFGGPPGPAQGAQCFLAGTQILTPGGEVKIDTLRIGDLVTTVTGTAKPIKWIGKRRLEKQGAESWDHASRPVRVAKDAFGEGSPRRDLYLSQAHMVYLGGVLIPIGNLINGQTISLTQPDSEVLDYLHIELESHHVLLAEGAPCESLLVTSATRKAWDNVQDYFDLYGQSDNTVMMPFAPIASFNGGRNELKSRLRSVIAPVIDVRKPIDLVRDYTETRAAVLKAA